MKKLAAALVALLLLAGCSGADSSCIRPVNTRGQPQGTAGLLGTGEGVLQFAYETVEAYTHLDIWVEVYQNGELVEPQAVSLSLYDPDGAPRKGRIILTISEYPDFVWNLAVQDDSEILRSAQNETPYPHPDTSIRAFGSLDSEVPITDGREIVLCDAHFTDRETSVFYNTEEYASRPELALQAENLHLIKCRFYSEAPATLRTAANQVPHRARSRPGIPMNARNSL